MARIDVRTEVSLSEPTLVEGFPGVGLVGKIAADHLVSVLEMTHHADVHCESLPKAASFGAGDDGLRTPVRLYADAENDLLVLQSDVPVSPDAATEFAECVDDWFREESVTPLYIAGLKRERPTEDDPAVFGVAAGDGAALLDRTDVPEPTDAGIVSGPTGALLNHALATDLTAVGLFADCDPRFPDPRAARAVLEDGVAPIADVDVPVDGLEAHASQIQRTKERLARQMNEEGENSSQAQRLRMYQ
ncbi:proteasome assembly chaperone family protein [Halorarum halophilum]|uniref:Proteasome assembly chaperone family protein n=1 Tax=Halorarum halophilum TaxID=2743090 RepID=A0A7D5KKW9_9EURY|nr:PAC2 family protein [Halobaculum halophilum]QLG26995.1 proteasome assembly chaperone family protein [Halobaculum halophilum]